MQRRFAWRTLVLAVVLVPVTCLLWSFFEWPASIDELRFQSRLREALNSNSTSVDLSTLMPGDWELACNSSGYAGGFHLEKYGKDYPAVGAMQDSAWGLLFIAPDGSYSSASGNCRFTKAVFRMQGCMPRERATLIRNDNSLFTACAEFVLKTH